MSNVASWREIDLLSPDAANLLNRYIAERKGYYVYHYDKDFKENCYYSLWYHGGPVTEDEFERFAAEFRERGWHTGERKTEAEAWADVTPWASDEKYALRLVTDEHDFVLIHRYRQGWAASFYGSYLLVSEPERFFNDDQKALAIAVAWCEWDEKERLQNVNSSDR